MILHSYVSLPEGISFGFNPAMKKETVTGNGICPGHTLSSCNMGVATNFGHIWSHKMDDLKVKASNFGPGYLATSSFFHIQKKNLWTDIHIYI